MLKNISPLISPSLLKILAEMGHGDEIVFSDAHFPGHTFNPTVLRADGLGIALIFTLYAITMLSRRTPCWPPSSPSLNWTPTPRPSS